MSKVTVYLYNVNKMYVTVILYSEIIVSNCTRQSGKVP